MTFLPPKSYLWVSTTLSVCPYVRLTDLARCCFELFFSWLIVTINLTVRQRERERERKSSLTGLASLPCMRACPTAAAAAAAARATMTAAAAAPSAMTASAAAAAAGSMLSCSLSTTHVASNCQIERGGKKMRFPGIFWNYLVYTPQ